jgi:hypothetical protein
MIALNAEDGSKWRFHSSSALAGDDLITVEPAAGSGRWLRLPGAFHLQIPIAFGTADAAVLFTTPAGALLQFDEFAWEITANFTGGTSSAIGVSSTKTGFTTKGDLLGGAAGNVAAELTAALGITLGTIGAGFDTLAKRRVLWKPTEILRFDRITDAFTAGTGFVLATGKLLRHAGA